MKILFAILLAVLFTVCTFSQAPQKMSYQAVIRNTSNQLVKTQVGMQISILQGEEQTPVYVETQTPTPNSNGLVTIIIGEGNQVSTYAFEDINWSAGPYYIMTETDLEGGTTYTITGVSQLLSVPFAIISDKAYGLVGGMGLGSGLDADLLDGYDSSDFTLISDFVSHNHDGLYRPVDYSPVWSEIAENPFQFTSPENDQLLKFNGSDWINFTPNYWSHLGNSGTIDGTNFIGTTDNIPLTFRINNEFAGRIDNTKQNAFYGHLAGVSNTDGNTNVAIGNSALWNNEEGSGNTAIGAQALEYNNGNYNTAIGIEALRTLSTGDYNTAVGGFAGEGTNPGYVGYNNTFIGYGSGPGTESLINNSVAIGYQAIVTADNSFIIGGTGVNSVNVGIGVTAPSATLDILGNIKIADGLQEFGKVLTSDADGLAHWESSGSHYIGEHFGGGTVFFVYDNGKHGLIAAGEVHPSSVPWDDGYSKYTGSTGDGYCAGRMNTTLIISSLIGDTDFSNIAARLCADYDVYEDGVRFGDWYLPSIYELELMYDQRAEIGMPNEEYWSSTEYYADFYQAESYDFNSGTEQEYSKSYGLFYWPIRSF